MTSELEVLFSAEAREVEIACAPDRLIRLGEAAIAGSGEFTAQAVSRPNPYGDSLRGVRIVRTESTKVVVTVDPIGAFLQISGDRRYLEVLGLNLRDLANEGTTDEHLHIDYFPGHYYLDEASLPVVVRLLR